MWCAQCQADVATEISADGQSLLCTTCNNEVRKGFTPSLHPETKSARELLERWAKEQNSEEDVAENEDQQKKAVEAEKLKVRLDNAHPPVGHTRPKRRPGHHQPAQARAASDNPSGQPEGRGEQTESRPAADGATSPTQTQQSHRVDNFHPPTSGPHFDLNRMPHERTRSGRAEILWGQLLAYGGVGVLTIGTALVLWGYFGSVESYASTGWLIATAGQMLLLLGIVTLVGGGMQQTTYEVSERIEDLGGRILRIEDSTSRILHSPHFDKSNQNIEEAA